MSVATTTPRLSRVEQREQTQQRLLDAAEAAFAAQGIAATPIEEIAEGAGFSRGAFYSNFADKDALVTALLERTSARNAMEIDELHERAPDVAGFFTALRDRETDESRQALSLEFNLYAVRNPSARPEVARILASSRERTARIIEAQWKTARITPPIDLITAARVVEALDDGLSMHRLIDPESYPLGMFVDVVSLLQEMLVAVSEQAD